MNKSLSILTIFFIVLLAGCTVAFIEQTDSGTNGDKTPTATPVLERDCFPFCDDITEHSQQANEKTFTISGVDTYREIVSDDPVRLVISGVRNEISVLPGTTVNRIIVSGVDITITLPKGSNPDIIDSGVRTTLTYS